MLNLFFGQLKEGILSLKVKQLEGEIETLTVRVDKLHDALTETQNVLVQVAKAQSEFVTEFEALIRAAQSSAQTPTKGVVLIKNDSDAWN